MTVYGIQWHSTLICLTVCQYEYKLSVGYPVLLDFILYAGAIIIIVDNYYRLNYM